MSNLAKKQQLKELRYLNGTNTKKIDISKEYIEVIHKKDDGYITLAVKDEEETFHQYCYNMTTVTSNEILEYFHALKLDTYASINSFFIPVRKSSTVRRINALYLDIDKHTGTATKKMIIELIEHLQNNYYNKVIPSPTITVATGRGLQLIFLLEHLPSQALKFWQNIENELAKRLIGLNFNGFELDESCTDVTRVFRLPGTINTRSNSYAKIIEVNDNIYRLDELKKEYFKYVPKTTRKRKIRVLNITAGQRKLNTYELHWKRREDIQRLQDIRKGDCEGLREVMCFLYRYYSCLVDNNCKEALDKMLKFNQRFKVPLPLNEVIKSTLSAEIAYKEYIESFKENKGSTVVFEGGEFKLKGYNYTNSKLIKILKITLEEQKHLLILIQKEEKYKRNNARRAKYIRNENGLTKREQQKEETIKNIKDLKQHGLKQIEIAKKLKINKSTVSKYLKL